ncbi:MAG TPA: FAD-dependent oxidoreductase [Solirubrobacteraceae bacterium]|nr:FAD-dependent oxidoreductase [Solirubrobacteraceae bacterium]
MRIAVVGAGVGGLAAGVRLAAAGHRVTVHEQAAAPGGKCGLVEAGGFRWDSGPSLVTMPWVLRDLLGDAVELLRVEPVTRYRFPDGSEVELSADLPRALEALEAWSPRAGQDWMRFLGVCAGMWQASVPFLTGPPPWPPRPMRRGDPRPDPRDLLRVKPWHTLRTLARATIRDPRLRLVVERFATYAGADPRRAPAALAVAGYVEHAFGAWHPRGGVYEIVRALVRRLEAAGGELRLGERVEDVRALGADAVVDSRDAGGRGERSLSGFALMLGLRGRTPGLAHHTITFPRDYDAEFDDVFVRRRPVADPTIYVSVPEITEGGERESWFVLVNAPAAPAHDWDAYGERLLARLGIGDRVLARAQRSPADLERETGAIGGAIYGRAPHGRLGTLRRPGQRGPDGVWRVGGTVHPGGGLPLVMLGAATVARAIGPA